MYNNNNDCFENDLRRMMFSDDEDSIDSNPFHFPPDNNQSSFFPYQFDNFFHENESKNTDEQKKTPNDNVGNDSQKKTTATNKSPSNSLENNIQITKNISYELIKNIPNSENPKNSNELNQENIPKMIFFEEIMSKYEDLGILKTKITGKGENTKNIEQKLSKTKKSNNSEKKEKLKDEMIGKKRKNNNEIEENIKNQEKEKTKLGRKTKECKNTGGHSKMAEDNLMFKIKSNFNNWILRSINRYLSKDEQLSKINFKDFSKNINTKENILFLNTELHKLYSKDISEIYNKKIKVDGVDSNEKIIGKIMESNDEKYTKVKKILKMTYKDALDLYRFKENETNLYKTLGFEILNEIKGKEGKEGKGRVDEFLLNTLEEETKDDKMTPNEIDDFVSSLLVMIYNYERWFLIKTPRKHREKKEKNIIVEIKINEE